MDFDIFAYGAANKNSKTYEKYQGGLGFPEEWRMNIRSWTTIVQVTPVLPLLAENVQEAVEARI
jgi:hypothetical protein